MTRQEKQQAAEYEADRIYHSLARVGVACYRTPSCDRLLWIPWTSWSKHIFSLCDTKAVSHALVMTGYMRANIPMRATVVDAFITLCRYLAVEIKHAPDKVKSEARAMRMH